MSNSILSDIVNGYSNKDKIGLNAEALKIFNRHIKNSEVNNDDWNIGGVFSGFSSESGFKKVSQIVKGVMPKPRLY